MIRENIYAALFEFWSSLTVGGSPAFKLATRKLKTWEDVEAEDQPALLQLQRRETVTKPRGLPAKWTFSIDLYLYVHTGAITDTNVVPSQLLNPLMDAVEAALTIDDKANDACTLGGLVSHCFIDGAVETFEGNLGDQAVMIIPLTVVVPT
jgi:hypothetical protein